MELNIFKLNYLLLIHLLFYSTKFRLVRRLEQYLIITLKYKFTGGTNKAIITDRVGKAIRIVGLYIFIITPRASSLGFIYRVYI